MRRKTLGQYIRQKRLEQGLSLADFTDKLQCPLSIPYLSDLERDRRGATYETLADIAQALNLDLDILCWHARIYPPDIAEKVTIFSPESIRQFFARLRVAIKEDTP